MEPTFQTGGIFLLQWPICIRHLSKQYLAIHLLYLNQIPDAKNSIVVNVFIIVVVIIEIFYSLFFITVFVVGRVVILNSVITFTFNFTPDIIELFECLQTGELSTRFQTVFKRFVVNKRCCTDVITMGLIPPTIVSTTNTWTSELHKH